MSDQIQSTPDQPVPERSIRKKSAAPGNHAPFPGWLAQKFLEPGEEVAWVGGPRKSPSWERLVTNPLMFVAALVLSAICVGFGRLVGKSWSNFNPAFGIAAFFIPIACIFILGIFSGHFTRLVVTNRRMLITQGNELVRSWSLDRLPRSLIRYHRALDDDDEDDGRAPTRTVDLDALKNMLGSNSDQFVEAKSIMAFAKQMKEIRRRENDRR